MTNQIPEDVKQKISELANAYGIVPAFSNQTRIDHDRILHYIAGATGGYTLGLQSAEKRVKDGVDEIIEFCNEQISNSLKEYGKAKGEAIENMLATECMTYGIIKDKAKQLLSK